MEPGFCTILSKIETFHCLGEMNTTNILKMVPAIIKTCLKRKIFSVFYDTALVGFTLRLLALFTKMQQRTFITEFNVQLRFLHNEVAASRKIRIYFLYGREAHIHRFSDIGIIEFHVLSRFLCNELAASSNLFYFFLMSAKHTYIRFSDGSITKFHVLVRFLYSEDAASNYHSI